MNLQIVEKIGLQETKSIRKAGLLVNLQNVEQIDWQIYGTIKNTRLQIGTQNAGKGGFLKQNIIF